MDSMYSKEGRPSSPAVYSSVGFLGQQSAQNIHPGSTPSTSYHAGGSFHQQEYSLDASSSIAVPLLRHEPPDAGNGHLIGSADIFPNASRNGVHHNPLATGQNEAVFYSLRPFANVSEVSRGANIGLSDHAVLDAAIDSHSSAFQNLTIQQLGQDLIAYHPSMMDRDSSAPHHNHSDSGVSLPPYEDSPHVRTTMPPPLSWGSIPHLSAAPAPGFPTPRPKPNVVIKIQPNTLKSRAEKQVYITLTFENLPPHYVNIHFPRDSLTRPKNLTPPPELEETKKKGRTLHLTMYCVSYTWVKKNGLELPLVRARKEAANVRRDPARDVDTLTKDDPTHPRNGAQLVICRKCKERERKRLERVKEVKDCGEWADYEDDHFTMINEQEFKVLSGGEADSLNRPGNPTTKCVTFKLRFACYCRHQEEPPTGGYKCIFTLWDFKTMEVLGQGVTDAFSITDDHKVRETMDFPMADDSSALTGNGWKVQMYPVAGSIQSATSNAAFSQPPTPMGPNFPLSTQTGNGLFYSQAPTPVAMAQSSTPSTIHTGSSLPASAVSSEPATPNRQNSRPQSRGQYPQVNLPTSLLLDRLKMVTAQPMLHPLESPAPYPYFNTSLPYPLPFDQSTGAADTNWQPPTVYQPQQVSDLTSPVEQQVAYTGNFGVPSVPDALSSKDSYSPPPDSYSQAPGPYSQSQQFNHLTSPTEQATPGMRNSFFDNMTGRFSSQRPSQADPALPIRAQSLTDFAKYYDVMGGDTFGDASGNYPSAPATAAHTPRFTLSRPPSPGFQQPHVKRQRQGF